MNIKEFQETYCKMCGSQRCGGVNDKEWRTGCLHYQREIISTPALDDILSRINEWSDIDEF